MNRKIGTSAGALLALAGAGLVGVGVAAAQEDKMWRPDAPPEAIIYRDAGYQGPAVNVSEPQPNLGLAWRVNAIRVRAGRWQLCERASYRGNCRIIDADRPVIGTPLRGIRVQSMRPLGGGLGGNEPGRNPSLRGMASEFYPAPARGGYRVLACPSGSPTADCAERSANQFCSAMGWRRSAGQTMETVRQRVYLADVLCTNSAF
jgi:hypothetical protein